MPESLSASTVANPSTHQVMAARGPIRDRGRHSRTKQIRKTISPRSRGGGVAGQCSCPGRPFAGQILQAGYFPMRTRIVNRVGVNATAFGQQTALPGAHLSPDGTMRLAGKSNPAAYRNRLDGRSGGRTSRQGASAAFSSADRYNHPTAQLTTARRRPVPADERRSEAACSQHRRAMDGVPVEIVKRQVRISTRRSDLPASASATPGAQRTDRPTAQAAEWIRWVKLIERCLRRSGTRSGRAPAHHEPTDAPGDV